MEFISGRQKQPWKILLYGNPGIGKSSIAAKAPNSVFCDLEDGLKYIDCAKTKEPIKTYAEYKDFLKSTVDSDFETVVFDTTHGLDLLLQEMALKECNEAEGKCYETLAAVGFQNGWKVLAAHWALVMKQFEYLNKKGKNVILVGHDRKETVKNPMGEDYTRYSLQLHPLSAEVIYNKMDGIFFCMLETFVKNKQAKDFAGNTKKRATSSGERILYTEGRPAYVAKNRFDLGESVPMSPEIFSTLTNY